MAERSAHVPGEGNCAFLGLCQRGSNNALFRLEYGLSQGIDFFGDMFYLIHNTRTVGDALLELATLPLALSQPIDNQGKRRLLLTVVQRDAPDHQLKCCGDPNAMVGKLDGQQVLSALQPTQQCIAVRTQCFSGLGDIAAIGQEGVQRALKNHGLRRQPPQRAQDKLPGRTRVLGHQRHHPHLIDRGNGGGASQTAHQSLGGQGFQV